MESSTLSLISGIFVIAAAILVATLCSILIVAFLKFYRPVREATQNSVRATEDLRRVAAHLADVSEETAQNLAQTSRNLVAITDKARDGTEDLTNAIRSVDEAAQSIGATATTATRVAEMIGRLIPQGTGGGATGVGGLLRLVRGMFGGRQTSGDGGGDQGT